MVISAPSPSPLQQLPETSLTSPSRPFSADLPLASGKQYRRERDPGDPGVQLQQSLHQQVRAWSVLPSHQPPRSSLVGRGSSCLSWSRVPVWGGGWRVRKTLVMSPEKGKEAEMRWDSLASGDADHQQLDGGRCHVYVMVLPRCRRLVQYNLRVF